MMWGKTRQQWPKGEEKGQEEMNLELMNLGGWYINDAFIEG